MESDRATGGWVCRGRLNIAARGRQGVTATMERRETGGSRAGGLKCGLSAGATGAGRG